MGREKCGQKGIYFVEEKNIVGKIIKHKILFFMPGSFIIVGVTAMVFSPLFFIK
jgi:hypothetical protein